VEIPQVAAAVLQNLTLDTAVAVLDTPGLRDAGEIIEAIPRDRVVPMLTGMSADRVADVFRELEDRSAPSFWRARYRDQGVGPAASDIPRRKRRLADDHRVRQRAVNWTVAQTLQHVRMVERSRETVYAIYILDPRSKVLLKALPLRRLITADPMPRFWRRADAASVTISPHASRDDATRLIAKYDLLAVRSWTEPANWSASSPSNDVIDAIVERQNEEVQRFAAWRRSTSPTWISDLPR